ncbi:MAG: T9SS type A sorting domain-containing protein [Bacteroidota bacterium]
MYKLIAKGIFLIFFLTCSLTVNAQAPSFTCEIEQYKQLSKTELEFVIKIYKTNANYLELALLQYGINVNPLLANGGVLSVSLISGFSDLNSGQQPQNILYSTANNQIRITSTSAPGSGNGTVITPSARVCKVKLSNTSNFGQVNPDLAWSFIGAPGLTNTVISTYVNGINTSFLGTTYPSYYPNPTNIPIITIPDITGLTVNSGIGGLKCRGGLSEQLTITGIDFGNSAGVFGKVFLKDANLGSTNFFELESSDIVSWNNTQIVVMIPANTIIGILEYQAGSGSVKVINYYNIESSPSSDLIEVVESYRNIYTTPTTKARVYLNRKNCNNGILFRVSSNIASNSAILATIDRALADWSIKLGVELKIERSGGFPVTSSGGTNASDNINTIYLATYPTSPGVQYLMKTNASSNTSAVCAGKYYQKDNDIEIVSSGSYVASSPITWYYIATGNLPSSQYDFYSAFLHEVGHVLGLNHVVDPIYGEKELMNYAENDGPKNETDRTSLISADGSSGLAGIKQSTDGKVQTWTCANLNPLFTIPVITNPPGANQPLELFLCTGNTLQLKSNNVTGNTWSTGAATQTITVSSNGTFTVSNTINSCTSTSAPVYITQNTLTGITNPNNQTICNNGTAIFSCFHPNAVSYQWQQKLVGSNVFTNLNNGTNFSGVLTATLQVIGVSNAFDARQYRCLVSSANACAATSAATLTVSSSAFGRLPSQYNNVANYLLTQGSPSPGTYTGTSITGGNTFHPLTAGIGTHTITYTPTCGSGGISQPIIVVPAGNPTTTTNEVPSPICIVANANYPITVYCTFLGSYNAGNIFQVQLSNSSGSFAFPTTIGTTTNANSTSVACTIPGTTAGGTGYQIRINATNPMGTLNIYNTKPIVIDKVASGTCNQQFVRVASELDLFNIAPNPVQDLLTVNFEDSFTGVITVTNLQGENIAKEEVNGINKFVQDLSKVSAGVYFINVNGVNASGIKKFIKN